MTPQAVATIMTIIIDIVFLELMGVFLIKVRYTHR